MPAKIISAILTTAIIWFFLATGPAIGYQGGAVSNRTVTLYYFWGEGCPHCAKAKPFLEGLSSKYPGLKIKSYEVFSHKENLDLLSRMAKSLGMEALGVPAFFIGGSMFTGFSEQISRDLREKVRLCMAHGCPDPFAQPGQALPRQPGTVTLPFLGEVVPTSFSLPVLTVVIAGLDSFNPCAFFVLFFLLSLLLHTHSRKRMALIGGTFVLFSGLVYFLFMAAWLTMFLVVGHLPAITVAAGTVALLIASINIKDFFFFRKGVSLSIPETAKPNLFQRMRNLLTAGSLPAIFTGTIVLAAVANSYELLCTAGFPMVFTRILTLHSLTHAEYYLYLAFYNVVYVIPLAVIVTIFVITLGSRKLTAWQGRILKLVSGLMMLCLGLALLINPDLLNNALMSAALLVVSILTAALIISVTKKVFPGIEKF